MRSVRRSAAGLLVVGLAVTALLGPADASASHALPRLAVGRPGNATVPPSLVVDPANWSLESGENVSLRSVWVGVPPGCALQASWFRWTVQMGGSEGTLGPTNQSVTTFRADGAATGTTAVAARSTATLRCDGNATALTEVAVANVTVLGPVALANLTAAPNPVSPGTAVELAGSVVGGVPPYRLRVAWGDGTESWSNLSSGGPFAVGHVYGTVGGYAPSLLLIDSTGDAAAGGLDEPVNVSAGFAAAIRAGAPEAEVGVPVAFAVTTLDAPSAFSAFLACPDAVPGTANASVGGLGYRCEFAAPGVIPVTFEAAASGAPYALATARLEETVAAAPALAARTPAAAGEVEALLYVPITLAGGVPPFTVNWSLVGDGATGELRLAADGTAYVPVVARTAGNFDWSGVAVDAFGIATPVAVAPVDVDPAFGLAAAARTVVAPTGLTTVNVSASLVGGTPPYAWAFVPTTPAGNASRLSGSRSTPGSFGWNATFRTEGPLGIEVVAVDAVGVYGSVVLSVPTVAALRVAAAVSDAGNGRLELAVRITGGLPPYAVRVNDSDADLWNGTVSAPGGQMLPLGPLAPGPAAIEVRVADALGAVASAAIAVEVARAPGTGAGPGTGDAAAAAAGAVAALAVAGYWAVRRRRRATVAETPPPDPVAVLKDVIAPCDGVDREMVDYLAEEQGLSADVVQATLAQLERDGRLRVGRGSDGEEVYAWVEPYPP